MRRLGFHAHVGQMVCSLALPMVSFTRYGLSLIRSYLDPTHEKASFHMFQMSMTGLMPWVSQVSRSSSLASQPRSAVKTIAAAINSGWLVCT